jgi:hypothetical protein
MCENVYRVMVALIEGLVKRGYISSKDFTKSVAFRKPWPDSRRTSIAGGKYGSTTLLSSYFVKSMYFQEYGSAFKEFRHR